MNRPFLNIILVRTKYVQDELFKTQPYLYLYPIYLTTSITLYVELCRLHKKLHF